MKILLGIKTFILGLLIFSGLASYSQKNFFIIKLVGRITLSDSSLLSSGRTVSAREMLTFEDSSAYAFSIDDRNQMFILMPIELRKGYKDAANIVASPVRIPKHLETSRPEKISNLKDYFGDRTFSVIGDSLTIPIDNSIFLLDNSRFIVFVYDYNKTQISKRIPFEKGRLIVNRERLLETRIGNLENKSISTVDAFIYNSTNRSLQEISRFKLQFISQQEIENELKLISSHLKKQGLTQAAIKEKLLEYFAGFYGFTDDPTLDKIANGIIQ